MEKEVSYPHDFFTREFVGQGVNVRFEKKANETGLTFGTEIVDGNGDYMGRVEFNSSIGKTYVDVRNCDKIKRKTLVNLFKAIYEAFELAFVDEVAAEVEPNAQEQAGD